MRRHSRWATVFEIQGILPNRSEGGDVEREGDEREDGPSEAWW